MLKHRLTLLAVLLLALATITGCTRVQKYAAGGAALGAVVGGIAGNDEWEEGALFGALGGGLVGALVGDYMEEEAPAPSGDLEEENRQLKAQLQACQNDLEAARKKIADLENQIKQLQDELAKCKGSRTEISLLSDVLFRPGSNRLSEEGIKILNDAAAKIKAEHAGKFVMVEGHTDSDPIRASKWTDNWELGSGRSLAVLRQLIKAGIDPAKASAATFGQYQPVADNAAAEGKQKNRRAVIVIYSGWPK